MNLRNVAALIPEEFRKEILELDMISNAVADAGNSDMSYLAKTYKEYIDPQFDGQCGLCLGTCLKNWKQLLPHLIELHKEQSLINDL